jgi:nitrate/nitrite transport system ATP-binding protein
MPFLELRGVHKSYGDATRRNSVLKDINLAVEEGELLAIVGYSGAGKSTLVQIIAGLAEPDRGTVELGGKPIAGPGPDRGVVFQGDSLLPWMTTFQNVHLAVERVFPQLSEAERRARTERYLTLVKLQDAQHKRPHELSGGMRQRVAVARALAQDPKVLLMDEPFSALDALTRATLADRIVPLGAGPGATLGPPVAVDIARPRDRKAINRDPKFKMVRNSIISYLIGPGARRKPSAASVTPTAVVAVREVIA